MKKYIYLFALLSLSIACHDDDEIPQPTPEPEVSEIDKLPPATQNGANTVGCLLNGKAFLPSGKSTGGSNSNPYCAYYHDSFVLVFRIVRNEENFSGNGTESVAVYSSNVILQQETTYSLQKDNSNHYGAYRIMKKNSNLSYETNDEYIGELYIDKLDKENNIISGTFWFDAANEQGKTVEIREGRFDMVFEGWAG